MKKLLLFVTMAASLLFTQCKKEESVSSAGKTVSMTVTAGPGSKTDITPTGAITWSTGDKLYVGDGSKYIGYLTIASGVGTPTGTFTGNVTLPTDTKDGEKSFGFFYLGSTERTLTVGDETAEVDFSSQNIYAEDGKLQNASACHVGYGSAKGTVINDVVTDINVMLVSKVALAHFSFKKGDAAYTDGLTLKGDNICNKMTVNFDGSFTGKEGSTTNGISLGNGHGERYVMLVPTSTVADQALTFAGDNVAGTATLNDGIKPNQFYGKDTPIAVTLTPTTIPVTGVTLNKTELSLEVGGTATLTATVAPDDATDKSVTWSSSATGVATVSDAGVVTAVAAGEATITVTTVDGNKTATCTVTVTAPSYLPGEFTINSSGTKVKFSKGNLWYDGSAFHFEENQWSFASTWNASHVSHFFWSKSASVAYAGSYSESGTTTSDEFFTNSSSFQVAGETAGTWRTLSKAEWDYLLKTRTDASYLRAWKDLGSNVKGLVILPDGTEYPNWVMNQIASTADLASYGAVFLPAAGYRGGTNMNNVGSEGYYWSSTPNELNVGQAYDMYFRSGYTGVNTGNRRDGHAVRLVR